jgi:hypothetical protein
MFVAKIHKWGHFHIVSLWKLCSALTAHDAHVHELKTSPSPPNVSLRLCSSAINIAIIIFCVYLVNYDVDSQISCDKHSNCSWYVSVS